MNDATLSTDIYSPPHRYSVHVQPLNQVTDAPLLPGRDDGVCARVICESLPGERVANGAGIRDGPPFAGSASPGRAGHAAERSGAHNSASVVGLGENLFHSRK